MEQEKWFPFLSKFCLFSLLFGLLFFSVFYFSFFYFNHYYRLDLAEDIETVVLGNSHPQCAINDELLTKTKNLSRAGEPIYYVLPKLQHLIQNNHHVKQVILELSDKEFQSALSRWMWSPMVIEHCTKAYWAFWPMSYHVGFIQKRGIDYFNYLMAAERKYLLAMTQRSEPFFEFLLWGGYKPSDERMKKEKWEESQQPISEKCDSLLIPVDANYIAFQELMELCNQKKIKLSLIRCPVHESLHDCFEKDYFRLVSQKMNLDVLDFRNLFLPDSCFRDAEHLNSIGATLFTHKLIDEGICQ